MIESLYASLRELGGQEAQLKHGLSSETIAEAFASTTADLKATPAAGPFYPSRSRKPLVELARPRVLSLERLVDTEHLQALLWQPTLWRVSGRPDLDFHFLARELTPLSSVTPGRRQWLSADSARRISIDSLLVNANDQTPIVAEIKVGGDENAELALVQALAGAAQLATPPQLRRVHEEYRDHLGEHAPTRLDVSERRLRLAPARRLEVAPPRAG